LVDEEDIMIIQSDLAGKEINLGQLNEVMDEVNFARWAWDYDHATYDYKYEDAKNETVYYLRVKAHVIEGEVEDEESLVRLEDVHIGKHLFPHGIDYEVEIPKHIVEDATKRLKTIKEKLN
jgi:hypothetical protein